MVNMCDFDLLGEKIVEDNLEIHISKDYFGGEIVNSKEALQLVRDIPIVNLAGTRIVSKVVDAKLASKRAVKIIGSTSFLLIFRFDHVSTSRR